VLRVGVLAIGMAGGLGSTGCESMNHTEKGALAGGALGTAAGLGFGALTGSPRTGAAIGGLAGAAVGGIAGSDADDRERRDRAVIQAQADANAAVQVQQQRMGIADVIDMARRGHADEVIITQIRNTGSTFSLAPSDLNMLKDNGVSNAVIVEMQSRPAGAVAVAPSRVYVREPQPPTTVIVREPYYRPPVVVVPARPYYYRPRPYFSAEAIIPIR
jgi:hypothetical protein